MRRFIKRVFKVVLVILALLFVLQYVPRYWEPAAEIRQKVAELISPRAEEAPEIVPEAKIYQFEAGRLRQLLTEGEEFRHIFAGYTTWETTELASEKVPLFELVEVVRVVKKPQQEGQERKEEEQEVVVVYIFQPMKAHLPSGEFVNVYLYYGRPVRVDYATRGMMPGLPDNLVPVAQRSADRTKWLTGWAYYQDVLPLKEMPLAPWGRADLAKSSEPDREVIDRYVSILQRGQWTEQLTYVAPSYCSEERSHWRRHWYVRTPEDATLKVKINGRLLVDEKGDKRLPYDQVTKGNIVVQVYLAKDSPNPEVPVEFVYCREKRR